MTNGHSDDMYTCMLRDIVARDGMLLPAADAGVRYLGYPTIRAASMALYRGAFPVPVVRLQGRKTEHWVRATDLVTWLAGLPAEQAGGAA